MADEKKSGEYTRQFYRVEYPEDDRPVLHVGEQVFSVLNISEKSGRFRPADGQAPAPGEKVSGTVTFHDGEGAEVEGEVLRHLEGDAVICFTKRIHFKRILKEQWFLMRKYRHLVK